MIADHIRACTFLIVDGVVPSNEGRGYVLRRIIRRAIRHGYKLGIEEPFFYKLVAVLEKEMGEAYPELTRSRAQVERVLKQEEERFAETLANGMALLETAIRNLQGKVIDGETVFKLYDTYGFPGGSHRGHRARARPRASTSADSSPRCRRSARRARAASKFGVETARWRAALRGATPTSSGYEGVDRTRVASCS